LLLLLGVSRLPLRCWRPSLTLLHWLVLLLLLLHLRLVWRLLLLLLFGFLRRPWRRLLLGWQLRQRRRLHPRTISVRSTSTQKLLQVAGAAGGRVNQPCSRSRGSSPLASRPPFLQLARLSLKLRLLWVISSCATCLCTGC
jgi:hypothetical protein